ncbi:hypothetical protein N333_06149, partial [Nestor notabilis]
MAGPKRSRGNCIRGEFSAFSNRIKKRKICTFFQTKVLDVRCGLPEEGSFHPVYSVKCTRDHQKGAVDVFRLEDPQLILTPGNSVLPVTKAHGDVHMRAEDDFPTPVEICDNETAAFPSKLTESYELSQKSGTTAETEWPWVLECPSAMEIEPSISVGFLESSLT